VIWPDQKRFKESREEFEKVLNTPDLGDIPVLILGNKCDKVSILRKKFENVVFRLGTFAINL